VVPARVTSSKKKKKGWGSTCARDRMASTDAPPSEASPVFMLITGERNERGIPSAVFLVRWFRARKSTLLLLHLRQRRRQQQPQQQQ